MTITTVVTPPGQGLEFRWPTAGAPNYLNVVEVPDVAAPSANTTGGLAQAGQPAPGTSTWGASPADVRPNGSGRITGLDKWEGKVLELDGDIFTAELYPIERDDMPITADFDLELLGSDAAAIVPGDVFYLYVRTVKSYGRRPTRTESLRLRRLGRITGEEVQAVYAKADALMERLEQLFD